MSIVDDHWNSRFPGLDVLDTNDSEDVETLYNKIMDTVFNQIDTGVPPYMIFVRIPWIANETQRCAVTNALCTRAFQDGVTFACTIDDGLGIIFQAF
jgi:hypothetical protein